MPRVAFLGLTMTDTLEARLLAALRGTYPTLTAGASDALAVQLVLRQWATDLLANYERQQAAEDPDAVAKSARDVAVQARLTANNRAVSDASGDIQVSATS